MNDEALERDIREYIADQYHLSLGTVRDNKPWVCEVHFANDEYLNLYFVSIMETRHCREIADNPNVSGNIVLQHSVNMSPHGVYFEGTAELLSSPSEEDIQRYCQRLNRDVNELKALLQEEGGRRMYMIKVNRWAVFGQLSGDTIQKYELAWGVQS